MTGIAAGFKSDRSHKADAASGLYRAARPAVSADRAAFHAAPFWTSAERIPTLPGAYVLAVELFKPIAVSIRNESPVSLAAGRYLYCGSAKGPGGLRSRIAHHMRHGKAIRWHVDNLTEAGRALGAWTFVGGHECELVAGLAHLPTPVGGFGSSDCRKCRSHLLSGRSDGIETLMTLQRSVEMLGRKVRLKLE